MRGFFVRDRFVSDAAMVTVGIATDELRSASHERKIVALESATAVPKVT